MTDNRSLDETRMALIPIMPAKLQAVIDAGEPVWDTDQLRADFEVLGFLAPFVVVRRKADDVKGSLQFTHSPRYYFDFQED